VTEAARPRRAVIAIGAGLLVASAVAAPALAGDHKDILITTTLALPLGLLVAWCLLAIVNVKAFGWRLPFHVFPMQLLWLAGVAMAAALAAAALPVIRLARMQPASLIRIFANER